MEGRPYVLLPYHFQYLPCSWQQPDYRPLFFDQQSRFPAKENYGPQCSSGTKVPTVPSCVPNCGCPAQHVVPFPQRTAVFVVRRKTTDWDTLGSLLCNDNVDQVRVLCEGTSGRMQLQRFLHCKERLGKNGKRTWDRRSKIHVVVCRPPLTDELANCYKRRYMWWLKK